MKIPYAAWLIFVALNGLAIFTDTESPPQRAEPGSKHSRFTGLNVFPSEVALTTRSDHQSLVIQGVDASGVTVDLTREADLSLEDRARHLPEASGWWAGVTGRSWSW